MHRRDKMDGFHDGTQHAHRVATEWLSSRKHWRSGWGCIYIFDWEVHSFRGVVWLAACCDTERWPEINKL